MVAHNIEYDVLFAGTTSSQAVGIGTAVGATSSQAVGIGTAVGATSSATSSTVNATSSAKTSPAVWIGTAVGSVLLGLMILALVLLGISRSVVVKYKSGIPHSVVS